MIKRCCIFFFVLLSLTTLKAQQISRYNTFSYSVNEGLLQSTIGDIEVDKNNFCWISFPNGIQQFNGNSFTNIKIQEGLPDDKFVKLFRCKNGDLLISHSKGISKYEVDRNSFTHVYKQSPSLQKPIMFMGEDNGIIYIYDESATIRGIDHKSFKIVSTAQTGLPEYGSNTTYTPKFSNNIIGHKIAFLIRSTIYLWDLQTGKMVLRPAPVPGISFFFLRLLSENEVLYCNTRITNALQCWDFLTGVNRNLPVQGKDDKPFSRGIIYPWHDKIIFVIDNRVFETDSTFQVLKTEFVNFQNLPVAGNFGIADIKTDNFGNLYLQTVTGGIKKIIRNNYPVKYYGTLNKVENPVLSILPDKANNRVLVGTNYHGLLIFDTLQRLIKHIRTLHGNSEYVAISSIVKDKKGNYILFSSGEINAWKLSPDLSRLTAMPFDLKNKAAGVSRVEYFGNPLFQNDTGAVVQSMHHIFNLNYDDPVIREHRFPTEYIMSGIWYDDMVITHGNNELIFLSGQTFDVIKKMPFPNTGGVRCFVRDNNGNILMGSNKGIFKIDVNGKILFQWNKENGLPDECIYSMTIDQSGSLWCSSNKGIFRINNNNNILQLTKEDGLQENEFNTNVVAQADDGEIYFGGVNGVSSFHPSAISSFEEKVKVLVTRVRVNNEDIEQNTAVWNLEKIKLPYIHNSLSFDFVAIANNNPGQYTYQYKMQGIDNEWLMNSGLQTLRYSLPPGKYILQLYASRSFDKDAKPMKEITIVILPPFWKTWWFLSAISILLISTLIYIINLRIKRKYEKRLQLMESERQLKLERERISKDLHDNLGAYANAVLYNTDLLEKEKTEQKRNELIGELKFASKDIITSLRETVWALKNENYTAEEILIRIRNFLQPFNRYYSHIHFKVIGEAPANHTLHYTRALNLVRIVQEAVSNSIKHSEPLHVTVSSYPQGNKWKIVIEDDGKGFDFTAAKKTEQGDGLHNLEHRAEESGFEFDLQTNSKGTIITIIV